MDMQNYSKQFDALLTENSLGRITITALAVLLLIVVIGYISKKPIVVFTPPTAVDDAWVSSEEASQDYLESWGLHLAGLLGNVAPNNVRFIKSALSPILSPAIYQEVNDALETQVQAIEEDQVSMRFEPKYVEYEPKTGKIFVFGNSYEKSAVNHNEEERNQKTYEFIIAIKNFAPHIVYINTYTGRPKNEKILEKLAREAEREARQERKSR
jgi:conjugal transfer pilus assembly protein TraE